MNDAIRLLQTNADRSNTVRTGDRQPINRFVRRGVFDRDGGRCVWCDGCTNLQLDHIIPWSAGGADRSDNLRLLCARCNNRRSNHRADMASTRVLPIATGCNFCCPPDDWWPYDDLSELVAAYCVGCRADGITEQRATL